MSLTTLRSLGFGVVAWGLTAWSLQAQQPASVQGLVIDAEQGRAIYGAEVGLYVGTELFRVTATDHNGFYVIGGIDEGVYTLRVRFLGYAAVEQPLAIGMGEQRTVSLALSSDPLQLEGVDVAVPAGAAVQSLGIQRITPQQLRRIPSPSGAGDLTSYLQTLPGVVTSGDRGGQLFIRGGTHTENLTLMDGLVVYQPFHSIGFFSVFPEELVSNADFYAGGFGARYSGRTASVLDVRMRDGDRNRVRVSGSASPFLLSAVAEGPVAQGRISWIAAARESVIDRTSSSFLREEQPVGFESQFLKVSSFGESDARCSATALRTSDRGRLDPAADDSHVSWGNLALGGRCSGLFDGVMRFVEVQVGYTSVRNATVIRGSSEMFSRTRRLSLELNSTNMVGSQALDAGYFVRHEETSYDLAELFGRQADEESILEIGGFVEAEVAAGRGITLHPGLSATILASHVPGAAVEPRLRGVWRPSGVEGELTGALGLYRQHLTGVSDVRDLGSVFVVWMADPDGSAMRSLHAQLGWQQRHASGLRWSTEGYVRWVRDIPVPVWTTVAEFNTELAPADGRVFGVDARLEWEVGDLYAFVGYGLSWIRYSAAQDQFDLWFGEPVQTYHPPHDRRHQVNAMATYDVGSFTLSGRWQMGTGLPFTRPLGFDEAFDYRFAMQDVRLLPGMTRLVVDKPYLGRLPAMHRLDLSIEREFSRSFGTFEAQLGVINAYDRRNLFFYDLFTDRSVDQLPVVPYLSVTARLP